MSKPNRVFPQWSKNKKGERMPGEKPPKIVATSRKPKKEVTN